MQSLVPAWRVRWCCSSEARDPHAGQVLASWGPSTQHKTLQREVFTLSLSGFTKGLIENAQLAILAGGTNGSTSLDPCAGSSSP